MNGQSPFLANSIQLWGSGLIRYWTDGEATKMSEVHLDGPEREYSATSAIGSIRIDRKLKCNVPDQVDSPWEDKVNVDFLA